MNRHPAKSLTITALFFVMLLLGACTVSVGTSFTPQTYAGECDIEERKAKPLGEVRSEDCQLQVFYILPKGEPTSTKEAVENAKRQFPGTCYLSDMVVEQRIFYGIGYSEECFIVEATAY